MIDVNVELPLPLRPVYALVGSAFSGKSTLARALSARGLVDIWPVVTTEPAQEGNKINTGHHVCDLEQFIEGRPYAAEVEDRSYFYALDASLEPRVRAPLLVLTPSQAEVLIEKVNNTVSIRLLISSDEVLRRARAVNLDEAEIENILRLKEHEDSLFKEANFSLDGSLSIDIMVEKFNQFSRSEGLLLEDPLKTNSLVF